MRQQRGELLGVAVDGLAQLLTEPVELRLGRRLALHAAHLLLRLQRAKEQLDLLELLLPKACRLRERRTVQRSVAPRHRLGERVLGADEGQLSLPPRLLRLERRTHLLGGLERALRLIKPDVVVACYGMNDGIYYPFNDKRFAAYRDGVRHLIDKVQDSQARLIMLTPIPFDPTPLRGTDALRPLGAASYAWFSIYEHYDSVLENYASWLITQADQVDMVIDLHTPLKEYAAQKKAESPDFTLAPDGVHLNVAGHRQLAYTVLMAWGMGRHETVPPRLAELVAKRQKLLHLAWLSHVGHLRPDVPAGQPLDEALQQADQLLQQILAP